MESNGMFDKYMKADKQFPSGTRELASHESTEDWEREPVQPEDESEDTPAEGMHMKHMEMMCAMMHMMQQMFGMFSAMLKSAPSTRKDEDEGE